MSRTSVDILDVRGRHAAANGQCQTLRQQVLDGLSQPAGQKTIPTMLLYDELGLRLYDAITTDAEEYYLFPAEEEILRNHSTDIVRYMHAGSGERLENETIVELGAGALRKTSHILRALAGLPRTPTDTRPITYYALDLEKRELERTLRELAESDVGLEIQGKVATKGLCATYDDGLEFIQDGGLQGRGAMEHVTTQFHEQYEIRRVARDASPSSSSSESTENTPPSTPGSDCSPFHLLFLGSSLGNFDRTEAVAFLKSLPLQPGSCNTLLLGLDHNNGREEIEAAYNDFRGVTRAFIMNGLRAAGRALGDEALFQAENWQYVGQYNEELSRHEAYYKSKVFQEITEPGSNTKFEFLEGEFIRIEYSHKYSDEAAYALFSEAELRPVHRWTDGSSKYSIWLLERPQFMFPLLKQPSPPANLYGLPSLSEWHDVWAVWDFVKKRIMFSSMLSQPVELTDVQFFYRSSIQHFLGTCPRRCLQERQTKSGDFTLYSHMLPGIEKRPIFDAVLTLQAKFRQHVLRFYESLSSGRTRVTPEIVRATVVILEHEAFHAETLLYTSLQRAEAATISPPGFVPPMWDILSKTWNSVPELPSSSVVLGPATTTLGYPDTDDDDDVNAHPLDGDSPRPKRQITVAQFRIDWRPVTNGEFYLFYIEKGNGKTHLPASWIEIENELQVRTLYGPVPIQIAWNWPIVTSFDNLSVYAKAKGGRLPTEAELHLFYEMFNSDYDGGANVGFRNWHPVPATTGLPKAGGRGHNGGVREWTATTFSKHDGFVRSNLYPGYSTDFFGSDHQVVIGGSYATIPRSVDRAVLRKSHQQADPCAWVGGRVAYDVV